MDNGAQAKVKMSGYLHKKSKKRMMSSWRNYWFVLEGRLLLYYRSKDEYQAISPCKGSINLGPPCTVKSLPSVTNAFQIETRTNTVTLRAENSEDQMKWMQTIMSALHQNQNFTSESPARLNHFRYSLDNLVPEQEPNDSRVTSNLERQNTMPDRLAQKDESEIIQRLQKMGAHSYGGSLGVISKLVTKKSTSPTLKGSQGSLSDNCSRNDRINHHLILRNPTREWTDNIYERISGDSNSSSNSNRTSFLVDNENYSVPIRKPTSLVVCENLDGKIVVPTRDTKSLLIDNDQYVSTRNFQSDDVIYSEPKINEVTDHNKNSVLVENSFYATANVKIGGDSSGENIYEVLDTYPNHYSEPVIKSKEISSQESKESRKKRNPDEKNKEKSLKKSKSFIRRVWKKKSKKPQIQETQDADEIYEEIDGSAVEKMEPSAESKIQMLSELHNILEQKITMLKKPTSDNSNSCDRSESEKSSKASTSNSDALCPSLPPKTQKFQAHSMYYDTLKTNQEQIRSLDEILEDLNKEKLESKTKVKMLIEKFSEPESDDVILRKHDKPDFKINRHSDDLNKLLNELAMVTSAPIMTPGVTSSLVNPNLSDEEWLKLLPVRQRRLSEPDYDVPRPHKSIQLPVKYEHSDAIPATRFFGPVLPPSPPTMTDNSACIEDSLCSSMTPDSLEVEQQKSQIHCSYSSHNYHQLKNETAKDLTCFSHNYQDDKIIYAMPKSYFSVATHIVNTCHNICSPQLAEECTIVYKNVRNIEVQDEVFSDSLELCNESATEF